MCEERFRDGGSALYKWTEPEVQVVCPRCSLRAVVQRPDDATRRLTCRHCGLSRQVDRTTSSWGEPVDPWFREPLWLQADFRGHTVWAFNPVHVKVLRDYVAADLRERSALRGAPMSMLEKLPGWMTSAKNRDSVVRVLDELLVRAA